MDEYRKHERREKMTQYAFPTKKNTFKANGLSINFACNSGKYCMQKQHHVDGQWGVQKPVQRIRYISVSLKIYPIK